jgi:hypothetical protein
MKCDLCQRDDAFAGRLLCAPCREALLRLRDAVRAIRRRRLARPPARVAAAARPTRPMPQRVAQQGQRPPR